MIPRVTAQRSILLAGTIAGILLAAPTFAQQPQPPLHPPPRRLRAPALPPGSPLIGRPEGNEAAGKLAPVAAPPIPAAADKLPTAKLKLPPGFNIEVYASGIANTRSLRIGEKGTVFVGTRSATRSRPSSRRTARLSSRRLRKGSIARRASHPQRHPLHRRAVADFQDRQHRGQSRQAAKADGDLQGPAEGRSAWLEVHRHRSRQQALLEVGQPGNNVLHDKDHGQIRRINLDGTGARRCSARRAQFGGLRLESSEQATLLLRQWPRLDVGGRAGGRAQSRDQSRSGFRRAILLPGQPAGSGFRLGP